MEQFKVYFERLVELMLFMKVCDIKLHYRSIHMVIIVSSVYIFYLNFEVLVDEGRIGSPYFLMNKCLYLSFRPNQVAYRITYYFPSPTARTITEQEQQSGFNMAQHLEKDAHSPAFHVAQEESPPTTGSLHVFHAIAGWPSGQRLCANLIQVDWYVCVMSCALLLL